MFSPFLVVFLTIVISSTQPHPLDQVPDSPFNPSTFPGFPISHQFTPFLEQLNPMLKRTIPSPDSDLQGHHYPLIPGEITFPGFTLSQIVQSGTESRFKSALDQVVQNPDTFPGFTMSQIAAGQSRFALHNVYPLVEGDATGFTFPGFTLGQVAAGLDRYKVYTPTQSGVTPKPDTYLFPYLFPGASTYPGKIFYLILSKILNGKIYGLKDMSFMHFM
jgi:hypothetical protein